MALRDVAAQVASLANDYGATHGPHSPNTFEVALFIGDPEEDGIEVSPTTLVENEDTGVESPVTNGYAPATITNDGSNFPAPDATTGILTTAEIAFPASLAEYPDTVTHWLLRDADTGTGWDTGAFPRDEQIAVESSATTVRVQLSIYHGAEV